MRTTSRKWASYTKHCGLLVFNVELLGVDEALGDYVIAHELVHSTVPSHGKLWKSLMHAHFGDYEKLEAELRRHSTKP